MTTPSGLPARQRRFARRAATRVAPAILLVAAVLALEAALPPRYAFPPARPFSGERWYHPYAGVDPSGALRANFHAHSRAWGGLANGSGTPQAIKDHYRARGYDVPGISNYHSIVPPDPDELNLPCYEHGWGVGQVHQTVVGARSVSWLDYPFLQDVDHRQQVIDELVRDGAFVVLNHPTKGTGYRRADLRRLVGYGALEVASRYGTALDRWDAALSAGRAVWGVASDDGHDPLHRASHSGIGWLEVHAADRSAEGILEALHAGRFHAVWSRDREPPNELLGAALEGDVLRVRLAEPADVVRFVGQGGAVLSEVRGSDVAERRLTAEDTYVRTEVWTRGTALFLNPVVRCGERGLRVEPAVVAVGPTRRERGAWGGLAAVLAGLALRPRGSRRVEERGAHAGGLSRRAAS